MTGTCLQSRLVSDTAAHNAQAPSTAACFWRSISLVSFLALPFTYWIVEEDTDQHEPHWYAPAEQSFYFPDQRFFTTKRAAASRFSLRSSAPDNASGRCLCDHAFSDGKAHRRFNLY